MKLQRVQYGDPVFIDKTSSAELSEALNSMFTFYRKAKLCVACMADVPPPPERENFEPRDYSAFRKSRWFTRGWTLQELLAPPTVLFVAQDWKTSIGRKNCVTFSKEDVLYSLMGLFGVQMPILYGEGAAAFQRLQMELLKLGSDESILAWSYDGIGIDSETQLGLLAASPSWFTGCHFIPEWNFAVPYWDFAMPHWFGFRKKLDKGPIALNDKDRCPYSMTNNGLEIEPMLIPDLMTSIKRIMEDLYGTYLSTRYGAASLSCL